MQRQKSIWLWSMMGIKKSMKVDNEYNILLDCVMNPDVFENIVWELNGGFMQKWSSLRPLFLVGTLTIGFVLMFAVMALQTLLFDNPIIPDYVLLSSIVVVQVIVITGFCINNYRRCNVHISNVSGIVNEISNAYLRDGDCRRGRKISPPAKVGYFGVFWVKNSPLFEK